MKLKWIPARNSKAQNDEEQTSGNTYPDRTRFTKYAISSSVTSRVRPKIEEEELLLAMSAANEIIPTGVRRPMREEDVSAVPKSTVNTNHGERGRARSQRACSDADSEGSSDDERCPSRDRPRHKKLFSHDKTSSRETSSPSPVAQHLLTPQSRQEKRQRCPPHGKGEVSALRADHTGTVTTGSQCLQRLRVAYHDAFQITMSQPRSTSNSLFFAQLGVDTFDARRRKLTHSFAARLLALGKYVISLLLRFDAFPRSQFLRRYCQLVNRP
ncbi:hypothetical protein Bbelb_284620 [Branchiostoma belcheri]|nr:hypothetical protein Bbelb_284620 [Branchiostoma belcheri]